MDEPVAGLDYGNQFLLLSAIKDLAGEGTSILLTTHHPEHAVFLGGRSLLIKGGEVLKDGLSAEVIDTETICRLYGIPEALVEEFSGIRFERKG
jgi:iron complex transport system ATP-binding protein